MTAKSADIIQFIPRPRHNRETDFPTITFKTTVTTADVKAEFYRLMGKSEDDIIKFAKEGEPKIENIPYGGAGIDGMWTDLHDPDKEPA